MEILNEQGIIDLVEQDEQMMEVLQSAEAMQLPDWAIGAGFVRNKVWDFLHEYKNVRNETDIDLIYFDPSDLDETTEKTYEAELSEKLSVSWSVKNQARMHLRNKVAPYASSEDAMADWPETATAIGVSLRDGELVLIAPHDIEDLIHLIARPGPRRNDLALVQARAKKKGWFERWPKLKVESAKLDS
jgi:hypothetical protein